MIRALRKRHAATAFVWLALCVPAAFAVAIAARRSIPALPSLPAEIVGRIGEPIGTRRESRAELSGVELDVVAWGVGAEQYVELSPRGDVGAPDVLVYWTDAAAGASEGAPPPPEAVLVGTLAGAMRRRFALPPGAKEGGRLLFFSLAHQRNLGSAPLRVDGS